MSFKILNTLTKYSQKGSFTFNATDSLRVVCNAPADRSGIYLVFCTVSDDIIYIGRSGKRNSDGDIFVRKAGLGGMKDRIVNGHQFGKIARRISWPTQMKIERIDAIRILWFATHDNDHNDCPTKVENILLSIFKSEYNKLPRWNKMG